MFESEYTDFNANGVNTVYASTSSNEKKKSPMDGISTGIER